MKVYAKMHGVSTIATPKIGCCLDQMSWQEVVKLLLDVFAYVDVHMIDWTLEENGVHAMSSEGNAEFYADDKIDRYARQFFLGNQELETDFIKDSSIFQYFERKNSPIDSLSIIYNINLNSGLC